ncbi:hypothetical protein EG329_001664 [Mollisiaceae sp. DMI_Dod_QoI]|nr:hypothetical protein EG329_001664 [Helotiales sp. DMI_Dod_QoI]
MFKFVAADGIGNTQKRHQARRACESCRRRKKACHHGDEPTTTRPKATLENHTTILLSPTSPSHTSYQTATDQDVDSLQGTERTQEQTHANRGSLHEGESVSTLNEETRDPQSHLQAEPARQVLHRKDDQTSRFIGDLNPEGVFLAAISPNATREGSIGVWITADQKEAASQTTRDAIQSPSNLFYGTGPLIQQFVPVLERQCLSTIPPPPRLNALTKIYFDKVYPILPVVDETACRELPTAEPHRILLQQGICLAASKNPAAKQHLVLDESASPLSCREFGEKISGAMRMSIEIGLVTVKTVIIQALVLMSQFTDNPIGDDLSSQFISRAVHQIQSLGLQLKDNQDMNNSKLFCCVWAMDRLNAALYGRPILMHERDWSADLSSYFEAQDPTFRLFLHVVALLDKVIDLYRPNTSVNPMLTGDFPAFEDVVLNCGVSNVTMSALATIEILYHAVSILSCRSRAWEDPQRSSTAYLRQSLSTAVLSSTVSCEEVQKYPPTLFPFIPYAISLAMSIAYREMRHSTLISHRKRSRVQFQTLCDALSKLEGIFWSASATSDMGQKLLKEMDRVFSTVSTSEKRPEQFSAHNTEDIRAASSQAVQSGDQLAMNVNGDIPNATMQDVDPSMFGSLPDIDIFGMFDPAFDLDGFDACLEGNLNPAFPTNFQ